MSTAAAAYVHGALACIGAGDNDADGAASPPARLGELLVRIRNDDPDAFEELLIDVVRPLELYARRFTGTTDAAKDIVQDVLAHLWEQRKVLRVRGSVRAYLYTAVRNRAINVRRRDAAERARWTITDGTNAPVGMGGHEDTADSVMERSEIVARVSAALDTLPPRAREAALLRWHDGLSRAEIADVMGVALGTVKNHLLLATQTLRVLLADLSDPT